MTYALDVREPAKVDDWIEQTVRRFGNLDGAVNLAGVIPKSIHVDRVDDAKDDEWKFVIDVNLHGGKLAALVLMLTRVSRCVVVVMHCMRAEIRHSRSIIEFALSSCKS